MAFAFQLSHQSEEELCLNRNIYQVLCISIFMHVLNLREDFLKPIFLICLSSLQIFFGILLYFYLDLFDSRLLFCRKIRRFPGSSGHKPIITLFILLYQPSIFSQNHLIFI